jgi:UPF0176 protein
MQIHNIAGYKFIPIADTAMLREAFLAKGESVGIKGTILLSEEGVNLNLAGSAEAISAFKLFLGNDERFSDISFHETFSDQVPFKHYKIKLKNEIITMRQADAMPTQCGRAPSIAPEVLKQWLDEGRDIILLDTRNDYEYRFGTFKDAINPKINQFGELPEAITALDRHKPVVMFCTGGIRCEKAALHMLNQGFQEVYQLDSGILGYFAKVGGAHYVGECFVFDNRIAVNANLATTGTAQCCKCQGPVKSTEKVCRVCG